jgi:FixJ family two-component response regulator
MLKKELDVLIKIRPIKTKVISSIRIHNNSKESKEKCNKSSNKYNTIKKKERGVLKRAIKRVRNRTTTQS